MNADSDTNYCSKEKQLKSPKKKKVKYSEVATITWKDKSKWFKQRIANMKVNAIVVETHTNKIYDISQLNIKKKMSHIS